MKLVRAVLLVGAISAPFTAAAETTHAKRVSFAGLDFTQRADVAIAEKRVKRAALEVCGYVDDRRSVHRDTHRERCYREAVDAAMAELERSKLRVVASS